MTVTVAPPAFLRYDLGMELAYTYEKGDKFLVGYLDDYPEYPTQGEDIQDLEAHLKDIYGMIQEGALEPRLHGALKIA